MRLPCGSIPVPSTKEFRKSDTRSSFIWTQSVQQIACQCRLFCFQHHPLLSALFPHCFCVPPPVLDVAFAP